jgi:isoleucyl-tRNA synthetase
MKTREVAHEVARRFEASTDYLTINRITIAVTNFFTRRWKEGLLVREGKPYMWSVKVRPPIRTAPASANSLPKPWTPGASSSRA